MIPTALFVAALFAPTLALVQEPPAPAAPPTVTDLSELSDAELREALGAFLRQEYLALHEPDYERHLLEAIERGGAGWEWYLETELEALRDRGPERGGVRDLELLTALRRVQGLPDPLRIHVEVDEPLVLTFPELPTFDVGFENAGEGFDPPTITHGGDYRGGRHERWRIDVRNAAGESVPVRLFYGPMRGGLAMRRTLEMGERWTTDLPMGRHIELPGPGEYSLRVLYHDYADIASFESVEDRVLFTSRELRMTWKPLEVLLTGAERARADELVSSLDLEAPPWLTDVRPGAQTTYASEPRDAAEELYRLGSQALPSLLDALAQKELGSDRRARVLGLLYSITGRWSPRWELGALGHYDDYRDGRPDEDQSRRMRWTLDEERQLELARAWLRARGCLVERIEAP